MAAWSSRSPTAAFAYVCNGGERATVAAQASIVFLDSAKEGETLIAEAEEVAPGRAEAESRA